MTRTGKRSTPKAGIKLCCSGGGRLTTKPPSRFTQKWTFSLQSSAQHCDACPVVLKGLIFSCCFHCYCYCCCSRSCYPRHPPPPPSSSSHYHHHYNHYYHHYYHLNHIIFIIIIIITIIINSQCHSATHTVKKYTNILLDVLSFHLQ